MVNAATVLPVVAAYVSAAVSVALAAGPASGFARGYVDRLEHAGADDAKDVAEADAPGGGTSEQTAADAAGFDVVGGEPTSGDKGRATADVRVRTHEVRVRARGLLGRLPQGLLAVLLCGATLVWGLSRGAELDTAFALPVVALLGVAGSVDAVCHRLPDRLLGSAALWLLAVTALRPVAALIAGIPASVALWPAGRAVLCALGAGAAVFVMWLIPASGMGLGDVKLCALLGLWLGYAAVEYVVTGLILGFVLAGLVAIGLMLTRRAGRKDMLAFGPYLAVGGWLAWLLAVA
ncbi:MAG: prepilin peptidase [Actinomyces ruminicola]|nr:prepilin peptidase [Actinomyces ruminicola]